jgi:hypothetical protein
MCEIIRNNLVTVKVTESNFAIFKDGLNGLLSISTNLLLEASIALSSGSEIAVAP